VSNFTEAMLTELIEETGVTPAVNQVELHPYFPQAALRAFHAEHGIRTESWSPLARRSELLTEQLLQELAVVHDVTPTQIVLRWHTQLGSTPIPKSSDPERQRENADVFGFTLTDDQVAAISGLERGRLWDGDPDTHEEM
jgi:2,5-diketo-D-gluconate reductase A